MTQKIAAWLAGFEALGAPGVDTLGPGEGWAIFPRGQRTTAYRADILGGERRRIRQEFVLKLCRKKDPRGDDPGVEGLLERLAVWVRTGAPVLGENQTVRLDNARLSAQTGEDMARYEASLVVEFEL